MSHATNYRAAMQSEVNDLNGAIAAQHAKIAAAIAGNRHAAYQIDGPEDMDRQRATQGPYADAVDDLDEMFRDLARQQAAVDRILFNLGYMDED